MMKLLLNVSILKNMRSFSGYKIGIISKSYPRIRDGRCLGGIKGGGGEIEEELMDAKDLSYARNIIDLLS